MIWATGDCHGNFERFRPEYFPEQAQMTKDDVVVVTGDFGGIWFGDARDDEALGCLESLPFTLAFVDGNHENYDALASYPAEKWQGGKIHRIRPHVLHLMRGQIYELEGYRFFTMGGAKSHDIEDGILEPCTAVDNKFSYLLWNWRHSPQRQKLKALRHWIFTLRTRKGRRALRILGINIISEEKR